MQIHHGPRSRFLSNLHREQAILNITGKYIKDVLKKFDMAECNSAKTPMHPTCILEKEEVSKKVCQKLYRGMIGSLFYLTSTRPDILFSVCPCARFQSDPRETHLTAVKRIFKLLRKDRAIRWNDDCQRAFEKIKEYLQNPPILSKT